MEEVGYAPGGTHATVHCTNCKTNPSSAVTGAATITNPDQFHTYTADWNADRILFYVDNIQYFNYSVAQKTYANWPFDYAFNIILNLAVGGDWGGLYGVDDSSFPWQ
jgi:beta-glucanase (GH16 family)